MAKASLRSQIEQRAESRCEYCQAPQQVCGYRFHLEHIVPLAENGSDTLDNRALACASCNLAKANKIADLDLATGELVKLFHPREQTWAEHFHWNLAQKTLIGNTPSGRATVKALDMNSPLRLAARQLWFSVGLLP